jgi:SulP family sulfate permease
VTKIDWNVVLEARDEIGALILVCTIGASFATTALEIGAETELEPNHELRAHGVANMASALVGGIPAFTLAGPSLTYLRLGASSRLMPILRALFSLALGVAGLRLLGFVPKIMVGTLLILFAFGLVDEWLIRARHRLGFSDYIFVLIIAAIIILAGFLPGVGVGILIAVADFLIKYSKLNVIKSEFSGRDYRSDVERSLCADKFLREAGGGSSPSRSRDLFSSGQRSDFSIGFGRASGRARKRSTTSSWGLPMSTDSTPQRISR